MEDRGLGVGAANGEPRATTTRHDQHPASVGALSEHIRDAAASRRRLRIVGRGTWLDAGRPVLDAEPLRVDGLTGIVEYTPGDLTLTALAGTPLSTIAEATRAERQWLSLAPWGGDDGSLGATVATASDGPTSGSLGAPRDVVIGVQVVTGTGEVVRGGGRVVKNVAGFDLTRLMVGAWGTLGVIAEVSVRLRAVPEIDETLAVPAPGGRDAVSVFLARVREAAIAPIALELVTPGLAGQLGLGDGPVLLVRLAGNAELVRAQRQELRRFADPADAPNDTWLRLRQAEPRAAAVVRFSGRVTRLPNTWAAAVGAAAAAGGFAHASVERGVARVVVPLANEASDAATVRDALARSGHDGARVCERLPAALWSELAPGGVADRLSRGVRDAFDPRRVLNPGIVGEEPA